MTELNPASALEATADTRSGMGRVRMILYAHLLAIILCAVLTLADTGQIRLPPAALRRFFETHMVALLVWTWFLAPIVMARLAMQLTDRSLRFRWGIVLLDAWLSLFQLWTMLPLVQ